MPSRIMTETLRLIEEEIPRLRRYARYLARDMDRADDLVQECLARAISNLRQWKPGTNLRAWLFVILRNVHLNELRRDKRTTLDGELPASHPALGTPGNQEDHLALLETQAAFNRLSPEHKEILVLVVIEGLAYEEAASVLDVPVGTVRSRLSRARLTLKGLLGDEARQAVEDVS